MLWIALALHVTDEALTNFLSVYNPTVLALRAWFGFWPMPTFEFREWLTGLALGVLFLASLSRFAFRNVRWIRPVFYFCAVVVGVMNALGHTIATILGHRAYATGDLRRPVASELGSFWQSGLASINRTKTRGSVA